VAENLSVVISADTSSLQAQLALAKAEVSAYGGEVRKAPKPAVHRTRNNRRVRLVNGRSPSLPTPIGGVLSDQG
jgi:hypothetical protein